MDTGVCFVMIEPSVERTCVTTLGAERGIGIDSLQTSTPVTGDLVCVGLQHGRDDPRSARRLARRLPVGVEVVFDPGAVFAVILPL